MTTQCSQETVVIKIGGSTLGAHDTTLADVAALQRQGHHLIVVHGGGPAISTWLTKLETPTRFVRGLRVTDVPALEVVTAVLAGLINKQLVASLQALGAPAFGLSGVDGAMLRAAYEDVELGLVGRVCNVDAKPLETLLAAGFVPVVAPLALLKSEREMVSSGGETPQAQLLNVNADTVAGELSLALHADRLVFLTDVDGVRGEKEDTLTTLDVSLAERLLADGTIAGGMIPKVRAGLRARGGGAITIILDGRQPHHLLAMLAGEHSGTWLQ
ncbi:MAG: acetylglutamate kinase [Dehalococcoidia bacterium]